MSPREEPPAGLRLRWWGIALVVVVAAGGLWWALELREGKGAAEQRAVRLRAVAESASARADSAELRLEAVEDSLDAVEDSLANLSVDLAARTQALTSTMVSTIDTVEAALPAADRYLAVRLRAQVDSLETTLREERNVWKARLEAERRRSMELRARLEAEKKAHAADELALEAAHDALDPPLWTSIARGLPELGAKAGGGYLACEQSLEACLSYLGAVGIDLVFDI